MKLYPGSGWLSSFFLFIFSAIFITTEVCAKAPPDRTMQEHVQQIFNKLVDARGDRSVKRPALFWTTEAGNGAFFEPGTNRITFEEKTYGVCQSFGENTDNAIAYVLAHEVIHYYKNHGWEAAFAKKFADQAVARDVKETITDIKQQETEADLLGGFLAFTAGYNTVGIAKEFLPKLYETFGWPKENPKYPTLDERILVAETTEKELTNLIQMFETANLLVAVQRFEDAIDLYEHILSVYKSRELVNNLGVVYCLEAINECDYSEIRFAYPLELDGEARLRLGSKNVSGLGTNIPKRDSLLRAGAENFMEAMQLDREYHTARLNLGAAYALLGLLYDKVDQEESDMSYALADVYARSAIRRTSKDKNRKLEADAWALLGIIAANKNNKKEATEFFKKGEKNSPLAKNNLMVLERGDILQKVEKKPRGLDREEIEAFSLDDFLRANPKVDQVIEVKGKKVRRQWAYKTTEFKQSKLLVNRVGKDNYVFFHITQPGYNGKTLEDIGLGALRDEIITKYKTPDKEIQLPKGHLLWYAADEIIFWLDEDQKLERWCVYRLKPEPK